MSDGLKKVSSRRASRDDQKETSLRNCYELKALVHGSQGVLVLVRHVGHLALAVAVNGVRDFKIVYYCRMGPLNAAWGRYIRKAPKRLAEDSGNKPRMVS